MSDTLTQDEVNRAFRLTYDLFEKSYPPAKDNADIYFQNLMDTIINTSNNANSRLAFHLMMGMYEYLAEVQKK